MDNREKLATRTGHTRWGKTKTQHNMCWCHYTQTNTKTSNKTPSPPLHTTNRSQRRTEHNLYAVHVLDTTNHYMQTNTNNVNKTWALLLYVWRLVVKSVHIISFCHFFFLSYCTFLFYNLITRSRT